MEKMFNIIFIIYYKYSGKINIIYDILLMIYWYINLLIVNNRVLSKEIYYLLWWIKKYKIKQNKIVMIVIIVNFDNMKIFSVNPLDKWSLIYIFYCVGFF